MGEEGGAGRGNGESKRGMRVIGMCKERKDLSVAWECFVWSMFPYKLYRSAPSVTCEPTNQHHSTNISPPPPPPPNQAKEKQAQLEHDKVQEEDDNFTEVCNHVNGDLLTENPDVAQSAFGPHRVIPDRWKGMSPSQLEEIKQAQEYQRQEKEVCYYGLAQGRIRVQAAAIRKCMTLLICARFASCDNKKESPCSLQKHYVLCAFHVVKLYHNTNITSEL